MLNILSGKFWTQPVCSISLSQPIWGGGGGGGGGGEGGDSSSSSSIMVHIADYQTTCCCCFKIWVACGGSAHESRLSTQNISALLCLLFMGLHEIKKEFQ